MKTKAMVAAEESDSEDGGFETCLKKKLKTNDLDDEEASLVVVFTLAADVDDNPFDINDSFANYNGSLSEDNNDKSSHNTNKGEENVENIEYDNTEHGNEDLADFEGGIDNGVSNLGLSFSNNFNCFSQIEVKEEENIKPFARAQSKEMKMQTPNKARGSGTKVKEDDFMPRTHCLAITSKNYIRELTALKSPFPLDDETEREEYIWTMIEETAQTKATHQNAFNNAQNNPEIQLSMIMFV
jgi:hypothetical protein